MLPGYNHNIRYKDKLFHVQTEDNGLDDPDLVTQVFLGGQIVAIERSSYGEVLVDQIEERERDVRIRALMQEQHKRLLKNLVHGEYDSKIEIFLKAEAARGTAPEVPQLTAEDAISIEEAHEPNFEALDAAILAAEQNPITPESLLAPDAVLELSTSELFGEDPRGKPLTSRTPPQPFLVEDLKVALKKPDGRADSDRFDNNDDAMLGMIEQHMHQQLQSLSDTTPSDPASARTLEDTPSSISHIQRAREMARNAEPARKDEFVSHVDTRRIPYEDPKSKVSMDDMPTKIGRRKPSNVKSDPPKEAKDGALPPLSPLSPSGPPGPPGTPGAPGTPGKAPDTLVDYGLPAALRREIDEEIARRTTTPVPGDPSTAPTQPPAPAASATAGAQKGGQRVLFRPSAPKPEGRYSSVRKPPVERPFDPPVPQTEEKAAPKKPPARERSTPEANADAARVAPPPMRRSASRPTGSDPKGTPPAGPARKIVEKQAPGSQPPQPPNPPPEDPKRPSILVVERSLDEVILSYLYDEMAEK